MSPASSRLRCAHCQDILGAYEPLVVRTAEGIAETSFAAEPDLDVSAATLFHVACFDLARDGA